jgi:hypothetical protein
MTVTPPWIPVGALAEGFAPEANTLPASAELAGKTFDLHFDNGWVIEHRFTSPRELVWTIKAGPDQDQQATESYLATSLRDGFYFVDFIKSGERATSVSLVFDLERGIFTAVIGQLPTEAEAKRDPLSRVAGNDELTPVTALFAHGTIDQPFTASGPSHGKTDELIGKRVLYTYSTSEVYEHIYLNQGLYTWHCINGVEKGLADTDACQYHKVDDQLYLFVWREKIIPTLGIIMIDLRRAKTTGKIMGYEGQDFGKLSNFQVGAIARVLNQTTYE